jgi:hypothetical protein
MAEDEFVRRLGEVWHWQDNGRVGLSDLLADAGLLVHEGLVLTRLAHEEFLRTSGALREIETARRGEAARRQAEEIRLRHACYPVEGGLNQAICEALIGLNARSVTVLSTDFSKGGLRSIPEVKDAVRDAWLSLRGLERQVDAAAQGEDVPTWPLLVYSQVKL